jgi:menaquinone-dependent protoporphyrinogen IX oxidase
VAFSFEKGTNILNSVTMTERKAAFDSPEAVACVEAAMQGMDFAALAVSMNAASGGALRTPEARNVIRLVGLAALRQPGRAVLVAGAGAQVEGDRLVIFLGHEIGGAKVP